MLSNILKWFGYTKDGSIVINSPSSSATVSGVVTFTGTSIQAVNGTNLPPQSFSISVDLSAVSGAYTFTASNSAGHQDDRTVIVSNVSPNNTIIYNDEGNAIVDSAGARWTLVGGVVYKNSATIGFSAGITELIYHNGEFTSWYRGPASSSWKWNGSSSWVLSTWPVPVTEWDHLNRWGVNGHITWGGGPYSLDSAQAAALVAFGANVYRNGFSGGDLNRFKQFISAYAAPAHIAVYPVALVGGGVDESASYAKGFSVGVEMGGLKGYVPIYELCNEWDGDSNVINGGVDGDLQTHYQSAGYLVARGVIRGVHDGILSVDPDAKFAGPGGTWLHYGFSDMLWFGKTPNGGSSVDSAKIVRWDVTTWHWYGNMGNPEAAGGGSKNMLSHMASYGVPLRMNEYGAYFSSYSDEVAVTNAITGSNLMIKWDTKRATYGITGADLYELYDDLSAGDEGKFGVVQSDGTTKKSTRWTAVAAYISAHP